MFGITTENKNKNRVKYKSMMFKNTVKLLCANFDKVWKLLVYHVLCIGVYVAFLAIFHEFYIEAFNVAFAEAEVANIFQSGTFYGSTIANALTSIVDFVLIFFREIFANVWIGLYFCLFTFYIFPLTINIGKVVICEMMYGYMSSCQKQSFTGTFLKTLKTSLAYSSLKVLYALPFNALICLSMWGLTRIDNQIFDYIMPFAFVIVPSLLIAFKETFNVGWAPAKVVYNHNIVSSYYIGMRAGLRRGARVFSTAFIIYLLAIVLSIVLGLYAIIIILPILSPTVYIFEMVVFFSSQGMRFYVDNDTILSPKRLEENDKIEDAKYIL